jgi:hypothetical protein
MTDYDYVTFTPQSSAPGSPAANEIYYKDGNDRLYLYPDGTSEGGEAEADLRFVPQSLAPTASRGRVYVASANNHPYVCTAN